MARYSSFENEPITRWNGTPIYLTTILTALFAAGTLFCALFLVSHNEFLVTQMAFIMPLEPVWSIWRAVTYVFIAQLSFFTPFSILCFYFWGLGIETHLGRVNLSKLLALLLITGPVVVAIFYWIHGGMGSCFGSYSFIAGLLIAFSTLYPNADFWGWVPFKWVAFACIVCGSLMLMADRDWLQLCQLLISCGVGFAYIRHVKEMEHDDAVPVFSRISKLFQRKPKFRVVPDPEPRVRSSYNREQTEVDALLDKISKSGMDSLTPAERKKLETLREGMIKRDKRP